MHRSLTLAATFIFLAAAASAEWQAGVAAYQAGDWSKARQEFEQVTQTNPDYAGAHYMLGLTLRKLGQSGPALQALQKANSLEPGNGGYAVALASALLERNQAKEAADVLGKADSQGLKGAQKVAFQLLDAKTRMQLGDASGALELARQATQADPRNGEAWGMLGTAQSRLDRASDSFASFRRAFELTGDLSFGNNAVASGMRAARLSRNARTYEEVANAGKQLYAKKSSPENALAVGEALMGAKSYDEALSWFDRSGLDNALVSYYKGQSYSGKNDFARSESQLRQALQRRPDVRLKKNIYASLGYVLDAQKKYGEAEAMYQEAGDSTKVAEMRDKQQKAAQNRKAAEEEVRIKELERIRAEMDKLGKGVVPTPPAQK